MSSPGGSSALGRVERTVTVTGRGSVRAVPDTAVLSVAAYRRERTMLQALEATSEAADEITRVAQGFVDETMIASADLAVWPAYDDRGRAVGFEARHALKITCPTVSVAGQLVASLAERLSDRLQISGVSLQVADTGELGRRATEAAYADACERGEQLAGLAGAELGEVIAVVEGAGVVPYDGLPRAMAADVGLQPGETSLSSQVTVTFALV